MESSSLTLRAEMVTESRGDHTLSILRGSSPAPLDARLRLRLAPCRHAASPTPQVVILCPFPEEERERWSERERERGHPDVKPASISEETSGFALRFQTHSARVQVVEAPGFYFEKTS